MGLAGTMAAGAGLLRQGESNEVGGVSPPIEKWQDNSVQLKATFEKQREENGTSPEMNK